MKLLQKWLNKAIATFTRGIVPKGTHSIKSDSQPASTMTPTSIHLDSKMGRLMELMGSAIEMWAKEYHLENMPKRVIFEQALDAMHIVEQTFNGEKSDFGRE
jgi:hypothetical protein